MRSRWNLWAVSALVFCASTWGVAGTAGFKLANLYAERGDAGFRHAVMARVDHRLDQLKTVMTGVNHLA